MADSTHPTAGPRSGAGVVQPQTDGEVSTTPSLEARRDIARRARRDIRALAERLAQQAPKAPTGKAQDDQALAEVIRRTVKAVVAAGTAGTPRPRRLRATFQLLGARCYAGGFSLDQVMDQVEVCTVETIRLLRHHSGDVVRFNDEVVAHARYGLEQLAESVTRDLRQELTNGYAAALVWNEPQADRVDVVRAALDDPGWDDAGVPRHVCRDELQSVAVLCADGPDALQRLDLAAHDAAVLIPAAVDAGIGERPLHRRVVFAGWSRQTWRDASAMLAAIGERYDLRVRTTVPAPGLRRLSNVYHVLLEGLPRNAAGSAQPGRITTAAAPA